MNNRTLKSVLKYITLAVIGVILFTLASRAAMPERPTGGIGGEVCLLALPLIWWIAEKTVKDLIGGFKRDLAEIKVARESESPDIETTEQKK